MLSTFLGKFTLLHGGSESVFLLLLKRDNLAVFGLNLSLKMTDLTLLISEHILVF